ncbi:hypothetical protein RSOLAG22IIIB_10454 [Rhizoctonia solani]|uniref:Uncharacterized protein n=1 Tax=Rhizoctonia solani TaxID=456999 RepID=A0A0K6G3Q8_9AGAM|nr:hypothetical protein RSOLAG22IIIB_10454 [Rhizoctonia solani]
MLPTIFTNARVTVFVIPRRVGTSTLVATAVAEELAGAFDQATTLRALRINRTGGARPTPCTDIPRDTTWPFDTVGTWQTCVGNSPIAHTAYSRTVESRPVGRLFGTEFRSHLERQGGAPIARSSFCSSATALTPTPSPIMSTAIVPSPSAADTIPIVRRSLCWAVWSSASGLHWYRPLFQAGG